MNRITIIGFGVPFLALILGYLCGKHLVAWLVYLFSFIAICCIACLILSKNSGAGSVGAALFGLWIGIALGLFLVSMQITFHITSDQTFFQDLLRKISDVRLVR